MPRPVADPGPGGTDAVLADLRAELDRIDHQLLDTLRDRIACCVEIGRLKARHGVPMMQPHRIDTVQRRAAAYGARHGVDREFLRRLYDLVIGETCRVEDLVIGAADRRPAPGPNTHPATTYPASTHPATS